MFRFIIIIIGYKELIIAGKSEEVIERVKADHPTIFETNKELHLLMKCQLFTEKYAEANHVREFSLFTLQIFITISSQ